MVTIPENMSKQGYEISCYAATAADPNPLLPKQVLDG